MGSLFSMYQNTEQANLEADSDCLHNTVDSSEVDRIKTSDKMIAHTRYQECLVTDAVENKNSCVYVNTSNITYEMVAEIERELSFYEKVALVFLLYDQEDKALQSLLVEQENNKRGYTTNLLSDWANSKHICSSSWQERFVEALCAIQNYALIRQLGLNKNEMNSRFLPTQPFTALHLDGVMKALYCLCEQLSAEDTKILLKYLEKDFKKLNMEFQNFDEYYLEMYLLHCFSMKYIEKSDLSNLIDILKRMGLLQKAEMLDFVVKKAYPVSNDSVNSNNRSFDFTKPVENYRSRTEVTCSKYSVIGDKSIVKTVDVNECYKINPENVGICLIINEKKFFKEEKKNIKCQDDSSIEEFLNFEDIPVLEERTGTEVDEAALSKIFKKLGFKIVIRENLSNLEMISAIKKEMGNFSYEDSCFVVCILSHGVKGKIYGANSIPVTIEKIEDTLHERQFKPLLGKPKVLIIQSCQGKEIQKVYRSPQSDDLQVDGPSTKGLNLINDNSGVPQKCDLLVCMSTVSGFASFRSKTTGSWYIQELCNTIDERCEEEHLQDILTAVHNKVTSKRWNKEDEGIYGMVPVFNTNLRKKLYLRKIRA